MAGRHTFQLRSHFRGPRFWSCAGHSSQHRNRVKSQQSTVQRRTAQTSAKGTAFVPKRLRRFAPKQHLAIAIQFARHHHGASIFEHKEEEQGSLPPNQSQIRPQDSGVAHHKSSGVQDGAAATKHGDQSHATGMPVSGAVKPAKCQRALMPHGGGTPGIPPSPPSTFFHPGSQAHSSAHTYNTTQL